MARKILPIDPPPPPSAQRTLTAGRTQTVIDTSDDGERVDDSGEQDPIIERDEDTPRPTRHTNSMPTVVGNAAGSLLTNALRLVAGSGDLGKLFKGGLVAGGGGLLAAVLLTLEDSPSAEDWATAKAQIEAGRAALEAHTLAHETQAQTQAELHTSTNKRIDALEADAIKADARTHANEFRSVIEIRLVLARLDQLADKQGIAADEREQLPPEIETMHKDIEAEHDAREREKARLDAIKIEEAMRARGTLPPP